jgi:hypothetical protein
MRQPVPYTPRLQKKIGDDDSDAAHYFILLFPDFSKL